jgi:hypothetical protein
MVWEWGDAPSGGRHLAWIGRCGTDEGMKLTAAVFHDTIRYDRDHPSRLVLSLTAPEPESERDAPVLGLLRSPLGTDRCDCRATYATDVVLEVSALAGHRIDHVVSSEHEAEVGANRVTIRIPEVRTGEFLQVVLGVTLKAQRQALPRHVNVFGVRLAYGRPGDGGPGKRNAEAKGRVTFAEAQQAGRLRARLRDPSRSCSARSLCRSAAGSGPVPRLSARGTPWTAEQIVPPSESMTSVRMVPFLRMVTLHRMGTRLPAGGVLRHAPLPGRGVLAPVGVGVSLQTP